MGSLWFSVIVLAGIQGVLARNCSQLEKITNCNECIRCGAIWCNIKDKGYQCSDGTDDWCPSHKQILTKIEPVDIKGDLISSKHVENTVQVRTTHDLNLIYPHTSKEAKIKVTVLNSTITNVLLDEFGIEETSSCENGKCISRIAVTPSDQFCPKYGTTEEFITLNYEIEGVENVTAKYHVPCACNCQIVEYNSKLCNGNGDYSCGTCSCNKGWDGEFCDHKSAAPSCDRGDISGCTNPNTNQVCSNNGRCECGRCVCAEERPGWQYFDIYCADICSAASLCDACLRNPIPGECTECYSTMIIENSTVVPHDTVDNGGEWISCNETTPECVIEYAARRDSNGDMHVIVTKRCGGELIVGARTVNVTVPAVLGVLVILAVVAAAGAFMLWKAKTPSLPLSGPQYHDIDAEDSTGINPLYKPPTSSYKNPTYGKC